MANKYWIQGGVDAHWDTVTDNWWNDVGGTQQSAGVPAGGDSVYLTDAVAPDTAPSVAVSLALFDTQLLTTTLDSAVTLNVGITNGGSLHVGVASGSDAQGWGGDASLASTILFQGAGFNAGVVGDNAVFTDTAVRTLSAVTPHSTLMRTTTLPAP
jgi:hypothetical protein